MDTFTLLHLKQLAAFESLGCVTVYLPTHPGGPDADQDEARLKNLADDAFERLMAGGLLRAAVARQIAGRIRELPTNDSFWQERLRGLVIFASADFFRVYRVPDLLEEFVFVDNRFHLRPLLPLIADNRRYWVMAIGRERVALLEGSRFHLEEVPVPGLPRGIAAWRSTVSLQPGDRERAGERSVGGARAEAGEAANGGELSQTNPASTLGTSSPELQAYCRTIHRALEPALHGEVAPLVLVGDARFEVAYRSECTYHNILSTAVRRDPTRLALAELHQSTWDLIVPTIALGHEEAARRFHRLIGSGRTIDRISDVLQAIVRGRVESLLLDHRARCWGHCDIAPSRLVVHHNYEPGDEDLINMAATETLLQRGRVVTLPREMMPVVGPMAAVLRP